MGSKIKPRQQRKPRSYITRDMILNNKGGPHKDKREKRGKADRDWQDEIREHTR